MTGQRTIELLEALLPTTDQPHKKLRDWGRKYSVHVGYARTSYDERMTRAISAELKQLRGRENGDGK